MKPSAVITGIGIVSPIGTGKDMFWSGLRAGASGIKAISRFSTAQSKCKQAAEVRDFKAEDYFPKKGLTCLSRTAEMLCAAANLARADRSMDPDAIDPADIGVVIGTAYGNIQSMVQFSEGLYTEGPRFVNPMLFPNTVINSPAGHVSILLGNQGLNVTISSGGASGLDAIRYAVSVLQRGEAQIIFAGGGDELSPFTYLGFVHSGQISGAGPDAQEDSAPFDKRRNGFFLGEGAAILVLENRDHAVARRAPILAEIVGAGHCFIPNGPTSEERKIALQAKAMGKALEAAGRAPQDISFIAASANGNISGDRIEARAIRAVFQERAKDVPISAFKSMVGESFGASGATQMAGAVLALQNDVVPPTARFQAGDADTALNGLRAEAREQPCRAVMINSFNLAKNCSTMVIAKPNIYA